MIEGDKRRPAVYLYWGQVVIKEDPRQIVLHGNITFLEVLRHRILICGNCGIPQI